MSYMNSVQTAMSHDAAKAAADSAKIADFAHRMSSVPRKSLRCEIYGTVTATVDKAHAMNIFRKVFGYIATPVACYDALCVLQARLDGDLLT